MSEKMKEIVKGLLMILCGVIVLAIKTSTQFYLMGVIPINTTVFGILFIIVGVLIIIAELKK